MTHLSLILLIILSIEIFFKVKISNVFANFLEALKKVFIVLSSNKISDNKKEKVIQKYAFNIFILSGKIFLLIFVLFSLFVSPSFFIKGYIDFIFSIFGLLELFIISFFYLFLRKAFIQNNE